MSKVYMSINEELDRDKAWGLAKYVLRRTNLCTKSTDLEYYEKLVKKLESKQTKDEKYLEVVDMYKQLVEALEPEQVLEV